MTTFKNNRLFFLLEGTEMEVHNVFFNINFLTVKSLDFVYLSQGN